MYVYISGGGTRRVSFSMLRFTTYEFCAFLNATVSFKIYKSGTEFTPLLYVGEIVLKIRQKFYFVLFFISEAIFWSCRDDRYNI